MRATYGFTATCLFGLIAAPAAADVIKITASMAAPSLAACMYRALRSENPGQMKLTTVGARGDQELLREMNGGGYSVFLWRADIRTVGKSASTLSVEVSRPLIGAETYEIEVRQAVKACAGA